MYYIVTMGLIAHIRGLHPTALFLKPLELEHQPMSFAISVSQLSIFLMRGGIAYSTDSGGACVRPAPSSAALDESLTLSVPLGFFSVNEHSTFI